MSIIIKKVGDTLEIHNAKVNTIIIVQPNMYSAHAQALRAIFALCRDGDTAVLEQPSEQAVGKLSYEIEVKTTLNGKPFPADPLEHQNAVAADSVESIADRLDDLVPKLPFIVIGGVTYKNGAIIDAQIGEALAPQQVTNICSQVNNYGDQPLDEGALLEIIRREIASAQKPGGALWSPK